VKFQLEAVREQSLQHQPDLVFPGGARGLGDNIEARLVQPRRPRDLVILEAVCPRHAGRKAGAANRQTAGGAFNGLAAAAFVLTNGRNLEGRGCLSKTRSNRPGGEYREQTRAWFHGHSPSSVINLLTKTGRTVFREIPPANGILAPPVSRKRVNIAADASSWML